MVPRKEAYSVRKETIAVSHRTSRRQNTKQQREIKCSTHGTRPTRLTRRAEHRSFLNKNSRDRGRTKEEVQEIEQKGGSKGAGSNKSPKDGIKVSKAAVQNFDDDHVIKI